MAVTYAHGRTHATVAFSGALDWAGAAELVDVVDMLVDHYFYARLELVVTSGGGDTDALEQVLGAMGRWERTGVRLCTVATVKASSAAAILVSLGTERVAAPHARLLYHHVLAQARSESITLTADEARAMHEGLVRANALLAQRLAERALRDRAGAGGAAASAEASDRAVLEQLAGRSARRGRHGAGKRRDAHVVDRLVRALGQRVEEAVARGDATALARLYLALADADAPISAVLARTLRLIDRVDEQGFSGGPAHPEAAHEALVVPQWRALYPPDGTVPLAALTRHTLVLGETGSGKSASAVLPVLAAVVRAPRTRVGATFVIDPKRELEPAIAALAPERLHRVEASDTVLNLMQGERWSLEGDLAAGRYTSAAVRVIRRAVSFVPDLPAQVLEGRSAAREPYWDLEGTELLLTVLAVLLMVLRPGAPEPQSRVAGDASARRWAEALERRARGVGSERGPNLLSLAAWALRGTLMRHCALGRPPGGSAPEEGRAVETSGAGVSCAQARRTAFVDSAFSNSSGDGDWLFGRVARTLLGNGERWSPEGRDVLERVVAYWEPLAAVARQFAGVVGPAVASTAPFAAPAVASTLYFGVEPGCLGARRERLDFPCAVSRGGEGAVFVFQPARDQLDNLVAVALKALFFEAVLANPDRVRGDLTAPLAMYIADEFQRYVTSDAVHGEQSFFDTCRSHRAACLVACQSVASLEHALSEGAGGARRDAAAIGVLWTNTANKVVFRTTDPATAHRLEGLCPQRPGLVDVVRARPPSTLGVGECYAALADGRFERRQLEPLVLEPMREAQVSRERIHAEEEERTDE